MDYNAVVEKNFFEKWRKDSDWGLLKSIRSKDGVPHTGPMWSSIYTGVAPGKHGIVSGGWLFKHQTWKDLKVKTVFDKIQEKYSLGLMTMPLTYPADAHKINGWVVSGFPVPDPDVALKPRCAGIDESLIEGFEADILQDWDKTIKSVVEKGHPIDRGKLELAKKLPAVDVLFIGYMQLDRIGHFNTGTDREYNQEYKNAEVLLQDTFDAFKPDKMIVCSDHGLDIEYHRHSLDGTWFSYPQSGKKDYQRSILEVRGMIEEALGL